MRPGYATRSEQSPIPFADTVGHPNLKFNPEEE
jgi:hypothetical protein